MIKEILENLENSEKPNKSVRGSRTLYIAALAGTLLAAGAFVCFLLGGVRTAQRNSITENAFAYSSLMDEKISVDLHGFLELNLDPALDPSTLGDFFHPPYTGKFADVRESAAECVEMAESLDDLILYRTSDNTLLSTMSDYHYLAKINPAYPYLMSALSQAKGDTPSFVYAPNGSILYYYPIPHGTDDEEASGHVSDCVIAVLHKSEDFLGVDISPSPLATFAVLREGQVLSIEGYNALSQKLVASVAGLAKSSPSVYTYTDANMPDYYFYIVHSQASELEYCYYEPVLTGLALVQNAFSPWQLLILVVLLLAAGAFGVLILVSSPKKPSEKPGEPEAVPHQEENVFGTLLNYSGIIIDYFNRNGKPTTPETLKLVNQIICDNFAFNKISYQASPQHFADCLEYYINYNNYNMRVFCDSLKMNLYNDVPEYSINIYYSSAVATQQEMEDDLFYLRKHLHYSLVLGYGSRLSIQQIESFEKNTEVLDPNVSSVIQGFLRTGAYEDLYAYLNHYKDIVRVYAHSYNFMTWYSFSERYRFAEEAFTTVKLFFQENGFVHPIAHATCNSVLRAKPGFGNLCEYLISCVQDYQQENQHTLSDHSKQLMNAIYKFIDEDLAGANLSSIARKMQMTDSHLSRMFKKNTGFNFSEYLSERRLEEAAKLLLQDTKLKVADVSDTLGYGNPTYFLSRFKAKYGLSPSAYRKAHLMDRTQTPESDREKDADQPTVR